MAKSGDNFASVIQWGLLIVVMVTLGPTLLQMFTGAMTSIAGQLRSSSGASGSSSGLASPSVIQRMLAETAAAGYTGPWSLEHYDTLSSGDYSDPATQMALIHAYEGGYAEPYDGGFAALLQ